MATSGSNAGKLGSTVDRSGEHEQVTTGSIVLETLAGTASSKLDPNYR